MPTKRKLNFDDLNFQPISPDSRTLKATLQFSNGYGCNVYYRSENTNRWMPYEFELLYHNNHAVHSELSDDNIGYSSKEDISDYIKIAQRL